jgi:5-methyltetrahydropteroyltriglutamate--homocysteine methyltransferase
VASAHQDERAAEVADRGRTTLPILPTAVVGSYPQPATLIDRDRLSKAVPRVRMADLWRVPPERLEQAQDEAAREAIADMERAGVDIVTDGEVRRESYSNHFVGALAGIDVETPGVIVDHRGTRTEVPRVVGPISRPAPVGVRELEFLRRHTDRWAKFTVPGPFTMAQQCQNEFYADLEETAMAFAAAVNDELLDLQAAGADVLQIDEPWLRNDPEAAARFAIPAIDRALAGITATTVLHLCFGYAAMVHGGKPTAYSFLPQLAGASVDQISIEAAQPRLDLSVLRELGDKTVVLGVLDLGDPAVESAATVADRIRAGLRHLPPERLVAAPDCGMKYLSREVAAGKLAALVAGARLVREELP